VAVGRQTVAVGSVYGAREQEKSKEMELSLIFLHVFMYVVTVIGERWNFLCLHVCRYSDTVGERWNFLNSDR
jgi:hypothetical protein